MITSVGSLRSSLFVTSVLFSVAITASANVHAVQTEVVPPVDDKLLDERKHRYLTQRLTKNASAFVQCGTKRNIYQIKGTLGGTHCGGFNSSGDNGPPWEYGACERFISPTGGFDHETDFFHFVLFCQNAEGTCMTSAETQADKLTCTKVRDGSTVPASGP